MKVLLTFALFAFATSAFAQTPAIHSGSTVYIEPMGGYETYLVAAFAKKAVPMIVVTDKSKAEYIIQGGAFHTTPNVPATSVVVNNTITTQPQTPGSQVSQAMQEGFEEGEARRAARGTTSASISVVDKESSQIVFAYSVGKSRNTNQIQSAAEACAKHLKEFIEKSEKPRK